MSKLFLCCAKSLEDRIEDLKKTGKKGTNAALQCLEIIETIRAGGMSENLLSCKRTHKGEARFDKCVKYDLGNGYRLITIRHKDHLYIPYLGTHDKADLWLEHNRTDEIHKKQSLFNVEKISLTQPVVEDVAPPQSASTMVDEYEEELLNKVDDTTLRYVFSGLVERVGR